VQPFIPLRWQLFKSHLRRTSRAPTEASFQGAWAALLAALQDAGAAHEDVVRYLNDTIYAIRERWAFCYRLGVLTLGINSTQRCEGYFSQLKAELVKVITLCHLKHTLGNITSRYGSHVETGCVFIAAAGTSGDAMAYGA
jgi:hypothetical protein